MLTYDPEKQPDPATWLATDEGERIIAVQNWHRRARVKVPNEALHMAFHVVVENQIAENLECVCQAMKRLRREGLSRHDAVHAIASVLAPHLVAAINGAADSDQATQLPARYYADVERLTAQSWYDLADDT